MSITELVESPGYKKFMGKVYGWGASVVILGALWKILHLPGANYMLIAGLGTESIIFFLSAFEPPHAMPDWSLVYPELVGLEPNESRNRGGISGGGSDLAALIQSGSLEPEVVDKLNDGIRKLTATTTQLSDLSDATLATDSYLKNMKNASDSVNSFAASQMKSAKTLEESASLLAQSYDSTAKVITQSSSKVAEDLSQSGEKLVATYSALNQSIGQEIDRVSLNSKAYAQQMEGMNKNLGAINSLFELQLKATNEQVTVSGEMTKGLGEIRDQLVKSVEDTKVYKDQIAKLSHSISELNHIYGNMLSAMNSGK